MMRIRHIGGEKAGKGNYWNFETGERITLEHEGVLPGDDSAVYYRANPLMILAVGPILGLVYAAFLPFIGIAMIAKLAITKVIGRPAEGLTRVATFNWRPTEAYLAGRRHKKSETPTKDKKPADDNKD